MKPEIHPKYKEITVIRTDGTEFKTRSTYAKSDTLRLDIDPLNHSAWTGGSNKLKETGRLARFRSRYGGLENLGSNEEAPKEKKAAKTEAKKAKKSE